MKCSQYAFYAEDQRKKSTEGFVQSYFNEDWMEGISTQERNNKRFAGIKNLGNCCYINSVIRCLAHVPPLRYFSQHIPNILRVSREPKFLMEFGKICKEIESGKIGNPLGIYNMVSELSNTFKVGAQQDAHEFLQLFIDRLESESKLTPQSKISHISALFEGEYYVQYKCLECKKITKSYAKFMDLSLPVTDSSLYQSLEMFFDPPELSEFKCNHCYHQQMSKATIGISTSPDYLIISLNRFNADGTKNEKDVFIPPIIDIESISKGSRPLKYQLFGTVNHMGHTIWSGHYISHTMCDNGDWYGCNDESVFPVSEKSVLGSSPYILFYRKKENVKKCIVTCEVGN